MKIKEANDRSCMRRKREKQISVPLPFDSESDYYNRDYYQLINRECMFERATRQKESGESVRPLDKYSTKTLFYCVTQIKKVKETKGEKRSGSRLKSHAEKLQAHLQMLFVVEYPIRILDASR